MIKIKIVLVSSFLLASILTARYTNAFSITPISKTQKATSSLTLTTETGRWYVEEIKKYVRNSPNKAIALVQKAKLHFKKHPDTLSEISVINEYSYALYFLGQYALAMEQAKYAELEATKNQFELAVARAKVLQGNVLEAVAIYEHAILLYQEAASYYRKHHLDMLLSGVITNLANAYYNVGQYSNAMNYYEQAKAMDLQENHIAKIYLGFANTYTKQDEFNKAVEYYQMSLYEYQRKNDQLGLELAQSGLGWLYLQNNRPLQAINLFDKALKSSRDSGRLFRAVNMLNWKSKALIALNQPGKALLLSNEAINLAVNQGDTMEHINALKIKAQILEILGNAKKSLEIYKLTESLLNKIKNSQVETQLTVMQAVFNLEKKNHQIDQLNSEVTIQKLKITQQRSKYITIASIIALSILILGFIYYRQSQNKLLGKQKQLAERLQELDKVKNEVMANTSHELRTPLNGIIGMTQILLDEDEDEATLDDDIRSRIKVIDKCGQRLINLVNDITDFSHLQSRKLQIKLRSVNILPVAQQVCSLLEQEASKKNILITLDIPEQLPGVVADPGRLHQILLNLTGNAVKFSQKGTVKISALLAEQEIIISVSDEGKGIPEEKMNTIFEPFEQVDGSMTRVNEGTGLGLPISRQLLELHNSKIEVSSQIDKGTTFSFRLPVSET